MTKKQPATNKAKQESKPTARKAAKPQRKRASRKKAPLLPPPLPVQLAALTALPSSLSNNEESPLELAELLLKQSEKALSQAQPELDAAKKLLEQARVPGSFVSHLSGNSTTTDTVSGGQDSSNFIHASTIGHCNTDHEVRLTGDPLVDRIAELKRAFHQRNRLQQPENKGQERWDKPRLPGQRRRRIVRDVDQPEAPSEPPSGYVVFVGQMTTKIRHDRPHVQHQQATVIQEIAKVWRDEMSSADRKYYMDFSEEAQSEYKTQKMEFRATGKYTASKVFERLGGGGPWVRRDWEEKNGLEREISQYETFEFPLRPPELEEMYQWNEWKNRVNRKLKMRGLIENTHNPEEQAIVEQALRQAKANVEELDVTKASEQKKESDDEGQEVGEVDSKAIINAATNVAMVKMEALRQEQR